MRFKEIFLSVCTAALLASMLSFMIMEARCVWDEDTEIHGDPPWWTWRNYAWVAGQKDQGSLDPRKYFDEKHDASDNVWSYYKEILYTKIEFFSDVYYYFWENNGQLSKYEEYTYWVGRVDTKITGWFHDTYYDTYWWDTAWASIANRGWPE